MTTADESADIKMALKHDPRSVETEQLAEDHPNEAAEALREVALGYDSRTTGSWVDTIL